MSDTTVAPAGQTVIADGHHDDHSHAALWSSAGDHRVALQLGTEGRFNDRNHSDSLKAFADLEARSADRFNLVLTAVKDEANRTRECIMHQKTDDLRFANLRLELSQK